MFDQWLGSALCMLACVAAAVLKPLFGLAPRTIPRQAERIIALKLCCLGDAILTGPAFQRIRETHPLAHLTVITTLRTSRFYESLPFVDEVVYLPFTANPIRWIAFIASLRARLPELVFCFDPWYRISALIAFLLMPACSLGFTSPRSRINRRLFTRTIPYTESQHVVNTYHELALVGSLNRPDPKLEFFPRAEDEASAAKFIAANGLAPGFVAIFPGSSAAWAAKRWPAERFAELADRITGEWGYAVALISGMGLEELSAEIAAKMRRKAAITPGTMTGGAMGAMFQRSRLVVSVDSAAVHVASAAGVPTVALFGFISPDVYRPFLPASRFRVVRVELPCSPCVRYGIPHECERGYECVQGIAVDNAMRAVREVMAADAADTLDECPCGRASGG